MSEVAMLEHAGHLGDALQLHLAPLPARSRLTQRFDEIRGFGAQHRQLRLDEAAQLLVQRRVRVLARALELPKLAVDFCQ
jgi:hypothetical protein